MPSYAKGDRIIFTGEVAFELFGIGGIVLRRRINEGHYYYDIKLSSKIPTNIPGLNISAKGILQNVPANWFELNR